MSLKFFVSDGYDTAYETFNSMARNNYIVAIEVFTSNQIMILRDAYLTYFCSVTAEVHSPEKNCSR